MAAGDQDGPRVVAVVPARMASTRFPDKPMAPILGMPMIGHVYHRTRLARSLDEVWVATCDAPIYEYIRSIGGKAVMTAATHEGASDRAAEALQRIEDGTGARVDFVALVQGDEPLLIPEMIDQLVAPVRQGERVEFVNLVAPIRSDEEFEDANTVKVVADLDGFALYFSREPIPSRRKYAGAVPRRKQLGLILFSREALFAYAAMPPTPLEVIESVDMNRVIEHGKRIRLVGTEHVTHGVDTPADLEAVEVLMRRDPLVARYQG